MSSSRHPRLANPAKPRGLRARLSPTPAGTSPPCFMSHMRAAHSPMSDMNPGFGHDKISEQQTRSARTHVCCTPDFCQKPSPSDPHICSNQDRHAQHPRHILPELVKQLHRLITNWASTCKLQVRTLPVPRSFRT